MMKKMLSTFIYILFSLVLLTCTPSKELTKSPSKKLPTPATNQEKKTTATATELDNSYFLKQGTSKEVYLYLSTKGGRAPSGKKRVPLNISVVIDRSGSMRAEDKLDYVKSAAKIIVDRLSEVDKLSIVTYSRDVEIVSASALVNRKMSLKKAIKNIEAHGVTNLSGGMVEGYNQVRSTFGEQYVNRVLLLSDGLANRGITKVSELQGIVKDKYRSTGIAISTFGVGDSFNEDLMTSLAEYGKGNYYFIKDAKKIPEIFNEELDGLLSVVAKNAKIKLEFPSEYLELKKVYGYKYDVKGDEITIDFNDIFSEEDKSVMLAFELKKPFNDYLQFANELKFEDVFDNYKERSVKNNIQLKVTTDAELHKNSYNKSVLRNVILFKANESMEKASYLVDEDKFEEAKATLLENQTYLDEQFKIVEPDTFLLDLYDANVKYAKRIDKVKGMTKKERALWQKFNKSKIYMIKKRKRK